jgi:hypothetical protein
VRPSWPRNPAGSGRGGDFRLGVLFLPDYDSFAPSDGALTKTRLKIRRDALLTAKTVRILPTARAGAAAQSDLTETERRSRLGPRKT